MTITVTVQTRAWPATVTLVKGVKKEDEVDFVQKEENLLPNNFKVYQLETHQGIHVIELEPSTPE